MTVPPVTPPVRTPRLDFHEEFGGDRAVTIEAVEAARSAATCPPSAAKRRFRWLLRPVVDGRWDRLLWVSGGVGLAGIMFVSFVPAISELAVLFVLTLFIHGPQGAVVLGAYEPVLIVFSRLHPVLMVAGIGTLGATMVEVVNYRIYEAAVHSAMFGPLRASRLARRVVKWFGMRPATTLYLCALTPIPFWMGRVAATLARYSLGRHLLASGLGRYTRFALIGALGLVIPISTKTVIVLGAIVTGGLTIATVSRARRDRRTAARVRP